MLPDDDRGAPAARVPHGGPAILSRYAQVLDTVANAPSGLALAEIGQRTKLPQATVYRLVHALVYVGFLAPGTRRKHYVLGPRLFGLVCTGAAPRTIRSLSGPVLEQLAAEFGETAFIAKLEGDAVETVAVATPEGETQAFVHPGRCMPFHAAASAKAILAFANERLVSDILAKPRQQYTARTLTRPQDIAAELAQVREQGFAVCDQELDPGVLSYACPIRIGEFDVYFSLGLVGFADRLRDSPADAIVASLKAAAATLSGTIRAEGSAAALASPPPNGVATTRNGRFAAGL